MALLNSLFAGVSGLRNHQTMMDVIGNNISNVNTIGFKGSRITFSDTFNQFVKAGTNPTATSGGTNTFQVGLGAKVQSIDRNWTQGTFERTGITTDLALQGQGMFVLNSNNQTFYTRAGSFIFDAQGKLVNPQNGAIVQGKLANALGQIPDGNTIQDIVVDKNLRLAATATTEARFGGNLSSFSDLTRTQELVQNGNINTTATIPHTTSTKIFDESGIPYTFDITYTQTSPNNYNLTYSLTNSTGTAITLPSGLPTTAVFDPATGKMTTPSAKFQVDLLAANGIKFDVDLTRVTETASSTTITANADNNRIPNIVNGNMTIFDSLGTSHNLTIKFTKIAPNSWKWDSSMPATSGSISPPTGGTISFNPDGSVLSVSPTPSVLAFTPAGGAAAQNITIDFGARFNGITQTSGSSIISALTQNGSASANLTNISIDQYGKIVGIFSNGNSRDLGQVMVATFRNINALVSVGDNLFTVAANTGDPFIGEAGETTGTTLQSGALEQSNVDLSDEFTKLIVSQRGFQANARVITTSDSLLQEITNLVR